MTKRRTCAGFTLAEVMVAAAVVSLALAALAVASVAIQRGFAASEYQVECQEDQLRAMDFLTRDVKRATSVTVENQNRKLTVTLPGYKVKPGAAGLSLPDVKDGTVKYAEAPLTVAYLVEGKNFMRYENGAGTVLSTHIEEFCATADDLPRVALRVNFVPHFSAKTNSAAKAATEVATTVFMRNYGGVLR
jgi:prepilin-type N-terminal cleavage/methylation domain-containing protein